MSESTTAPFGATTPAQPFPWRESGLDPLPWFPFTVGVSRGHAADGTRIARRVERAYWHLRRLLNFTPRFRLLALAPSDWARFAQVPEYGVTHCTADGHLIVGTAPAAAWHDVSGHLATRLPAVTLRGLVRVHGRDAVHPDGPDLAGVAETLVAHEVAHVIAEQAGATFARRWIAEAFADYALIAVLGETDPGGLHRVGTLAEAARLLPDAAPCGDVLDQPGGALDPVPSVIAHLALTRAAFAAYAEAHTAPLARWFAWALEPARTPPDADHELGRMLSRIVHPALGALASSGADWQHAFAEAA